MQLDRSARDSLTTKVRHRSPKHWPLYLLVGSVPLAGTRTGVATI